MGEKFKSSSGSTSVPTLTIPPRESFFLGGPAFSPGPVTLISTFLSDPSCPGSEHPTFSQLLAGAMASPLAKSHTLLPDNQLAQNNPEEQGLEGCDQNDKNLGFKKNRPMTLMVSNSPSFIAPFGFSSSGWLYSPGFFSPLQSPFGMSHQQALAHVTAQAALSQSYLQTPQGTSVQVLGHEVPTEPKESSVQVSQSEDKPPSDGYNWRKYGQKMLKTSECPRSYYKCTHLKCPVKKKVERSIEGHITEVTYKGQHNHELPQPSNRRRLGCAEDGPGPDCSKVRPDAEIEESSERVSAEKASELPVSKGSDEIDVSAIATDDGRHDDEPNVKRMKTTTTEAPDLASLHKTVSESKIIVQTRSEVDILNDGFKWRKYGQKVVKGNHHPRSYYRCTYPGCNVRKHVERASMDPKSVITTYEGKHNHEIPIIARNRSDSTAQDHNNNNNSDIHRLKEQEENITTSRPSSLHEKVAFQNNKEIPVCSQVKEA